MGDWFTPPPPLRSPRILNKPATGSDQRHTPSWPHFPWPRTVFPVTSDSPRNRSTYWMFYSCRIPCQENVRFRALPNEWRVTGRKAITLRSAPMALKQRASGQHCIDFGHRVVGTGRQHVRTHWRYNYPTNKTRRYAIYFLHSALL